MGPSTDPSPRSIGRRLSHDDDRRVASGNYGGSPARLSSDHLETRGTAMRPWRRLHSRPSGVTCRPRLRLPLAGQRGEEGLTLIELVVVIIILPIVVSGI